LPARRRSQAGVEFGAASSGRIVLCVVARATSWTRFFTMVDTESAER
ncbi:MAG: hypothetical protein ACI9N0_003536, partial [Ilumatobacter sp.]